MSRLPRVTQKIFASAAGVDQVSQIGSLAAGSPLFTTDIAVAQALANFTQGLFNICIGNNSPAIEDFNAILLVLTQQIAYFMQSGLPEWDSGTTYYTGSLVQDGSGNIYVSLTNANVGNALTDVSNWRVGPPLAAYNSQIGDNGGNNIPVNTDRLGDVIATARQNVVTMTIAAPCVVTDSTYAYLQPYVDKVYFTTTGTLPTGLSVDTVYYATSTSSTTYKLSTSRANARAGIFITTSGSQSGVHTVHTGGFSLQNSPASPAWYGPVTSYAPNVIGSSLTLSSAGYTITDNDGVEKISITAGAADRTINLPNPANNIGRPFFVYHEDNGAGQVIIHRFGSEKFGGIAVDQILNSQGAYLGFYSNGVDWLITSVFDYHNTGSSGTITAAASNTWKEITQSGIGPGRWQIEGEVNFFKGDNSTNPTGPHDFCIASASASAGSNSPSDGYNSLSIDAANIVTTQAAAITRTTLTVSSIGQIFYLNGNTSYSGSAPKWRGTLRAWRVG